MSRFLVFSREKSRKVMEERFDKRDVVDRTILTLDQAKNFN